MTFEEWFNEDEHDLFNFPEEAMKAAWEASTRSPGCSTQSELDEIMTLVFDAERYLKSPNMGGNQYGMAADNLREARKKYLAYRSKA